MPGTRDSDDTSWLLQVFSFARGQHNVVELTTGSCNALGDGVQLAGFTDTPFTYTVKDSGELYFACSVPGVSRFVTRDVLLRTLTHMD